MSKNLEDLIKAKENFRPEMQIPMDFLIPVLEDFDKRLTELEKFKVNTLGYYEINETGGVNNIKVVGTDPD